MDPFPTPLEIMSRRANKLRSELEAFYMKEGPYQGFSVENYLSAEIEAVAAIMNASGWGVFCSSGFIRVTAPDITPEQLIAQMGNTD